MLVCKRWKSIFDKAKNAPKPTIDHLWLRRQIRENIMSLNCAEFLIRLDSKREESGCRGSYLDMYVLENKIEKLYGALFIGEKKFFICSFGTCMDPICAKSRDLLEKVHYEKFCERFGVNPSGKGDREWVPKKRKTN